MKSQKKKPAFAVIDAETDPFEFGAVIKPFIWGHYDGIEYTQFDKTEELVDFLMGRDEIVYAHNGGKFDFHFLLDYCEPYSELMIINGRISKLQLGACELRDSWNIITVPLSAYKKEDMVYSLMLPEKRCIKNNFEIMIFKTKNDQLTNQL